MIKWTGKKVLVLGFSKSGISAAKLLKRRGYDVYITESKNIEHPAELENMGIKIETGGHSLTFVDGSEFAVTSPGIPPHSIIIELLITNKKERAQQITKYLNKSRENI